MKRLAVLLVDDHVMFRKGIASLLSSREDLFVVGETGNGCEAIDKARETVPYIILMDVHMPGCNGLDSVRAITREMPQVKIVMLTVDENDEILFEAVKSGAQGYLLKKLDPQKLFDTLEVVARGEVALSPAMMVKILNEFREPASEAGRSSPVRQNLSAREMDVLQQVVQGATNKEIADALSITENTVKKHLQSILSKLHLQNRIQAAVYAVREGLVNDASLPGQSLFVELLPADMAQVGHILKQNRAELSHLKDGSFLCTKRPGWGCCLASRSAKLGSRGSKKL